MPRSWKYNGADCYSFNRVCSPLGGGEATYHDYYGKLRLTIPIAEHEAAVGELYYRQYSQPIPVLCIIRIKINYVLIMYCVFRYPARDL